MLDQVVTALKEIDRRTGIERTLAIGELVLSQFFGGDPAAWRDRRRNKNNSIRRLADRADCPFCRSALNEAVGVYVAVLALPSVRTFGHICASHVASVLALPADDRRQMLEQAEQQHWSVRELRQKVVLLRRAEGERRGRPAARADLRCLSGLRSGVRKLQEAVTEIERIRPLEPELQGELGGVATVLASLGARLVQLERARPELGGVPRIASNRMRERTA